MDRELKVDIALVEKLLRDETKEPRDSLPYTDEFDRLRKLYIARSGTHISEASLMRAFLNAGKRGGFNGRRKGSRRAPALSEPQIVRIGRLAGADLAARGSLVYSPRFNVMHALYRKEFGPITQSSFWLLLDGVAKRAKGDAWKSQLKKAREAACLGVEIYNKPLVEFKSQAFVSLMVIAWTSLFQAFFRKIGIVPAYPQEDDQPIRYWELSTCLKRFFGGESSPVRLNLEFFIGLRNEVEHNGSPQLDMSVFGETQAMVMNFEDLLVELFGESNALSERLGLALQFSRLRDGKQNAAIRELQKPAADDISRYVEAFRSQLSGDIWNSLEYSYRVFLVPKTDKERRSDLAIEFAPFDSSDPDDLATLEKLKTMIVEKRRDVANDGWMKPAKVCREANRLLRERGIDIKLGASSSHAKLVRFYKIKPPTGDPHPEKTRTEFCRYDDAHQDYTYSRKWVEYIVDRLGEPGEFEKATGKREPGL